MIKAYAEPKSNSPEQGGNQNPRPRRNPANPGPPSNRPPSGPPNSRAPRGANTANSRGRK